MSKHRHERFRPAWAVVRIDDYLDFDIALEEKVYVKEVWLTEDEASAEAARLNDLAADKGYRYVVQYTRLTRGLDRGWLPLLPQPSGPVDYHRAAPTRPEQRSGLRPTRR